MNTEGVPDLDIIVGIETSKALTLTRGAETIEVRHVATTTSDLEDFIKDQEPCIWSPEELSVLREALDSERKQRQQMKALLAEVNDRLSFLQINKFHNFYNNCCRNEHCVIIQVVEEVASISIFACTCGVQYCTT